MAELIRIYGLSKCIPHFGEHPLSGLGDPLEGRTNVKQILKQGFPPLGFFKEPKEKLLFVL